MHHSLQASIDNAETTAAGVKAVEDGYRPFATAAAQVYSVSQALSDLRHLYQFSIDATLREVEHVLQGQQGAAGGSEEEQKSHEDVDMEGSGEGGSGSFGDIQQLSAQALRPTAAEHIHSLVLQLAQRCFAKFGVGVLQEDRLGLGLMLSQVVLAAGGAAFEEEELQLLLHGAVLPPDSSNSAVVAKVLGDGAEGGAAGRTPEALTSLAVALGWGGAWAALRRSLQEDAAQWRKAAAATASGQTAAAAVASLPLAWLRSEGDEAMEGSGEEANLNGFSSTELLRLCIVLRAVQPSLLVPVLQRLVAKVLGPNAANIDDVSLEKVSWYPPSSLGLVTRAPSQ